MTAASTKSKLLRLIPADQFGTAPEREARAAALADWLKVCNDTPPGFPERVDDWPEEWRDNFELKNRVPESEQSVTLSVRLRMRGGRYIVRRTRALT